MNLVLFDMPTYGVLSGDDRKAAIATIRARHYTQSVPAGKSLYLAFEDALVVFSIPANMHAARIVTGRAEARVWELTRLWAPDDHAPNLLTRAIAWAAREVGRREKLDALVSYADPNASHHGGIYQAASWVYQGQSTESRGWLAPSGQVLPRRAFHSGSTHLNATAIRAMGYKQVKLQGKHRYARGLSSWAIRVIRETVVAYPKPSVAPVVPPPGRGG